MEAQEMIRISRELQEKLREVKILQTKLGDDIDALIRQHEPPKISPYALPSQAYDEYFTPPEPPESKLSEQGNWKCQSCGRLISHNPIGTAAICVECGGTSSLREPPDIEAVKAILDKALQRCQEYPYKDWDASEVEKLIEEVKVDLNQICQLFQKKVKLPLLSAVDMQMAVLNNTAVPMGQAIVQAQYNLIKESLLKQGFEVQE